MTCKDGTSICMHLMNSLEIEVSGEFFFFDTNIAIHLRKRNAA